MRTLYIVIPGIYTSTQKHFDWYVRLAEDIMRRGEGFPVALEYRYNTCAFFRRMQQHKRAQEIANIIESWDGFNIVLIGHSNGVDLIQRALSIAKSKVDKVFAFGAATYSDLQITGFYKAFKEGRLNNLFVYASKKDAALKYAANLSNLFSFLGLGYGLLGYYGANNIPETFKNKVENIFKNDFRHNDYFSKFYSYSLNEILEKTKQVGNG